MRMSTRLMWSRRIADGRWSAAWWCIAAGAVSAMLAGRVYERSGGVIWLSLEVTAGLVAVLAMHVVVRAAALRKAGVRPTPLSLIPVVSTLVPYRALRDKGARIEGAVGIAAPAVGVAVCFVLIALADLTGHDPLALIAVGGLAANAACMPPMSFVVPGLVFYALWAPPLAVFVLGAGLVMTHWRSRRENLASRRDRYGLLAVYMAIHAAIAGGFVLCLVLI
jgi:hypothetical protein